MIWNTSTHIESLMHEVHVSVSLLNKTPMDKMMSKAYIGPHESTVLSSNIDVFYPEYGKVNSQ